MRSALSCLINKDMNISTMNVSMKAINSQIDVTRNRSMTAPRWMLIMPACIVESLETSFGTIFETMEGFGLKYDTAYYNENGQYLIEFVPLA